MQVLEEFYRTFTPLCIYLAAINVITFITFAVDKYKAVHRHWRIPERTLLLMGAFGGAAGALLAMLLFHHKRKKPVFALGMPLFLLIQIVILIWLNFNR